MSNLLAWLLTTVALWRAPPPLPKESPPVPKAPPLDDRFGYGMEIDAKPPTADEQVREIIKEGVADGKEPAAILDELVKRDLVAKPKPLKSAGGDGEFYFKDNVLDQLEYYIAAVKRLKKHDYDNYSMISRLGANLIPDRLSLAMRKVLAGPAREKLSVDNKLEPWFLQALPAFGAVCYTTDKGALDEEKGTNRTSPRIFYFNKYALKGRPTVLQPVSPDAKAIYIVGSVWDFVTTDTGTQETGISEVALVIEADGSIRPLKTMTPRYIRFPAKNKKRSHRGFERMEWDWPEGFVKFAKFNKMTPEAAVLNMFLGAAIQHEMFNASMIRVAVEKDGVTAQMNVNVERTPYFFRDRDVVVNQNGVKKRIFHIVRPHTRSNGATVKMHFRGLRKFDWNGYGIQITVPGLDHGFISEIPIDSLAEDSELKTELEKDHKRTVSQPVMARVIQRYLQARPQP